MLLRERIPFAQHLHVRKEALSSTGTTYRIVERFRRNERPSDTLGIIIRYSQSISFSILRYDCRSAFGTPEKFESEIEVTIKESAAFHSARNEYYFMRSLRDIDSIAIVTYKSSRFNRATILTENLRSTLNPRFSRF